MPKKASLPLQSDSSSDDDEEERDQLVINERFAKRFEEKGRFNELQRNKELLLRGELEEEDSESDESEDDDAELLSSAMEIDIIKAINSIRKKDPSVYDPKVSWFDSSQGDDDDGDGSRADNHKKKRFKDVLREQLLSSGADIDDPDAVTTSRFDKRRANIMYDREQESLRKDILKSIHQDDGGKDDDGEDDNDSDESGGNILVMKKKSDEEKAQEKAELERALSEMKKLSKGNDQEADNFLTDYISNKKWKEKVVINSKNADVGFSDDDDDEDENELDKMEAFESKYNFRFEELQDNPGANSANFKYGSNDMQVVGHSRSVEGSVRRVDTKRKDEREKHKEKKEKEKRVKIEELKRLKNLKRQELVERLKKISKVGGVALASEDGLGAIDVDALDEDWSPEKHEEMMRRQFNDDYYAMEEAEEDFGRAEDMDDLNEILGGDDDDDGGYEKGGKQSVSALLRRQKEKKRGKKDKKDTEGSGGWIDEDDILNDPSYDKQQASSMLEELYKLDYEDVVAGLPCRFKYKQVAPQSFGLTADDILEADDTELNKYVSLKKVSAYYNKPFDDSKASKKRKKLRQATREKVGARDGGEKTARDSDGADYAAAEAEQKKKRKRKKDKSGGGGKKEADKDALKARLSLYK